MVEESDEWQIRKFSESLECFSFKAFDDDWEYTFTFLNTLKIILFENIKKHFSDVLVPILFVIVKVLCLDVQSDLELTLWARIS